MDILVGFLPSSSVYMVIQAFLPTDDLREITINRK
jgi:hypothetical protein